MEVIHPNDFAVWIFAALLFQMVAAESGDFFGKADVRHKKLESVGQPEKKRLPPAVSRINGCADESILNPVPMLYGMAIENAGDIQYLTQVSYGSPGRGIKPRGSRERHYKIVRDLRRF
jgi:hypothetical protein